MLRIKCLILPALLAMVVVGTIHADPADNQSPNNWKGLLPDGSVISAIDFKSILSKHGQWLQGSPDKGGQLDLVNADLSGANLKNTTLKKAMQNSGRHRLDQLLPGLHDSGRLHSNQP